MKTNLDILEEKKRRLEQKIKKYERESKIQTFTLNTLARKERAYKLIKLGALFEICNLIEVDHRSLLGYLSKYNSYSEKEKKEFLDIGENILEERKKNRHKKIKNDNQNNKNVDIKDIISLIKLAKEKDIDIILEMQEKFNKKLLEHLTFKELEYLKDFIEKGN